jgi:adenosylhomocysteine nucleosidase
MLLRHLVGNFARQAITQHLQGVVKDKVEEARELQAKRETEPLSAAIVMANSAESGGLCDAMTDLLVTKYDTFLERSGHLKRRTLLIVETGTGLEATEAATRDLLSFHEIPLIFAAGFAASLSPDIKKGDIILPELVCNEHEQTIDVPITMDRAAIDANSRWHIGQIISLDRPVRTAAERAKIAASSPAIACDMETFAIARVCGEFGIPCIPVRVIADAFDDEADLLADAVSRQSSWSGKLGATAGALWKRPKIATEFFSLKQAAIERSDQLAAFLIGLIKQLSQPPAREQAEPVKRIEHGE